MRRRGQTTTEYMVIMSVVSIAIAAVLIVFESTLKTNTESLSQDLTNSLTQDGVQ